MDADGPNGPKAYSSAPAIMTTVYEVASTGDTGLWGMCLSVIALKGSSSTASALRPAPPRPPAVDRCSAAAAAKDRAAAKPLKLPLLVCIGKGEFIIWDYGNCSGGCRRFGAWDNDNDYLV